jgi:hypothetical protein
MASRPGGWFSLVALSTGSGVSYPLSRCVCIVEAGANLVKESRV